MNKRVRLAAVISLGLVAGSVLGDGKVFVRHNEQADILQPMQKVYIDWDGSRERLVIQTKYEGPAEEMVWLIPVPAHPVVQRADGSIFNDLSRRTYGLAIDFTDFVGLKITTWSASAGGSTSSTSPVEWHQRIGDYDVALLRPVGGEDVIAWLNTNDFAVPEKVVPTLEDYIGDGWWMVAARIHPDALSPITSEKLAKGTLHPLEMTFESSVCIYPMRLTRMVTGPVEELIYIEGPAHYEPATLIDAPWDIKLYGGPVRQVKEHRYLSDLERAMEVAEGRTETAVRARLTKLRRVFQPDEMTEDLIFREIDLAEWLASKDAVPATPPTTPNDRRPAPPTGASLALQLANSAPMRIAQAATQYGRWRDPNGIAPLIDALSSEALDQVKPEPYDYLPWSSPSPRFLSMMAIDRWSWPVTRPDWPQHPGCGHLRSCIWALGEISVEHNVGSAAEDRLLECVQHDNQLIRMEAYLALTKMGSDRLGPILADRLTYLLHTDVLPILLPIDLIAVQAEMNIVAEWIIHLGTLQQRDVFISILMDVITDIDGSSVYSGGPECSAPFVYSWPEWIVWRAASMRDERLIPALQELHSRLPPDRAASADLLTGAEAACGSAEATATVVRDLLDAEARILSEGQVPGTGSFTSLNPFFYGRGTQYSLRVRILWKQALAYVLFPMPAQASDLAIRSALSSQAISDWYALYLLAGIRYPQASDRNKLTQVWASQDPDRRLLAIDVLYVWGDDQMLLDLYDHASFGRIGSEIAWALATMKVSEAASIIEEQVRGFWNVEWLSLGRTFIHPPDSSRGWRTVASYLNEEMRRVEAALWDYFHPASGVLDDERLAALKRIAADRTIHAGMRLDLLGKDYGGTEWGLPLLEQAARDILAVDSSPATVQRIMAMMKSVGNGGFAVSPQ